MNIALFPSAFFPSLGGVEELTRQLALELKRKGHDVIILTNRWPRSLPRYEMLDGIPVYRLAFRTPDANAKAKISYALSHHLIVQQMLNVLRRHNAEVLHVQCVSSNAHYALKARSRLKIPVVVTLQGELTMDASRLFQRSEFARETLRRCAREAELVTGCSAKTLSDAEAYLGQSFERRQVIFNAADTRDFVDARAYEHAKPYLFALGRLVPQKGFDVLLHAFAAAGVESHDLLLAGEGPERQALEALAKQLGLTDRVRFLGRADRGKVSSLFTGCSFFLLPSRADEGLPVVCAEAMAAGKAIVATQVGGVPEIVQDKVSGLLVPAEGVAALAAAIREMATNSIFRENCGRHASRGVQQFTWRVIAERYADSYRRLIAGNGVDGEAIAREDFVTASSSDLAASQGEIGEVI